VKALKWQVGDPKQFEVKDQDHPGFYIRLCRGGAKTWLYRYMLRGRLRRLNIGRYPYVSCVEAFNHYDNARIQVIGGIDIAHRKQAEQIAEKAKEQHNKLTLSTLFHDHYYPRYASKKKSKKNDWHYFTKKIESQLGPITADDITPNDIERLIRPIEARGYNTGRLTLALLRKTYNWAMNPCSAVNPGEGALLGSDMANPCRHYRLDSRNKPKPIDRYLKDSELKLLWNSLGDDHCSRILKLQLLTGCRVGEVCGMHESELDRDAKEWLLPASRVKTARPHLIPLTGKMLELIGAPVSGFIFEGRSTCGHITNYSVNQRLKRLCVSLSLDMVRTHTMRRTFITHLARMGVSIDVRNRLTNHADHSIDGIYNMHEYLIEKREALENWEQELTKIISSPKQ